MSGRGKGKSSKKGGVTKSAKAGLQFPVGRISRYLKQGKYATRVGAGAPVYLAAVLEYLAAEVLELDEIQVKNRVQEARRKLRAHYADTCALAEQRGVCHQCVELDGFFEAGAGDPLRGGDGDLPHRLQVIRDSESVATGPWTQMLESLLCEI